MRKERFLFILGIWTMALSYLGFPVVIKKLLFIVTGGLILGVSYLFYVEKRTRISSKKNMQVDNNTEFKVQQPAYQNPYAEVAKKTRTQRRKPIVEEVKKNLDTNIPQIKTSHSELEAISSEYENK
jgi:hypothetical protein